MQVEAGGIPAAPIAASAKSSSTGATKRVRPCLLKQRQDYPERASSCIGLEADLLIQAGQTEAAMEVLNQGLAAVPDSTALLYARSMLAEQLDDLALMERDLRAIIALTRTTPPRSTRWATPWPTARTLR